MRLEHRAFELDDADAFLAINSSPDVLRYTGDPLFSSVLEAETFIRDYPDFDDPGFGRWACILKTTNEIVGSCGLKYLPELDEVDVGYRFLPQFWGRGLATEACSASIGFGFEVLDLSSIIGLAQPENPASVRVLEKSGMHSDGEMDYFGRNVFRYIVTKEQWEDRVSTTRAEQVADAKRD